MVFGYIWVKAHPLFSPFLQPPSMLAVMMAEALNVTGTPSKSWLEKPGLSASTPHTVRSSQGLVFIDQ